MEAMEGRNHRPGGSHHVRNTHVVPGMTKKQARLARKLDAPTVVVVLLVIPALVLEFSNVGGILGILSDVLNWLIYGWFVFEFLCMLYLVPDDREYFKHNKLDLIVLIFTVPVLPGPLQALWVLRLLRLIDMLPVILGRFISITLLPYALVLAFIAVFGGGVAFAHFEGLSLFDGMYWANTTVNTVGYGDVSAKTNEGKILSMALQWTGNVILALLIGGIAAAAQRILLDSTFAEAKAETKKDLQEIEEDVEEVAEEAEEVEEDVENLLKNVRNLSMTDRVILRELHNIKRRLDEVQPERREERTELGETEV
ncbi:MAG TPA: ion channel [Rubrobacteraceae bacterium]|nr:ion channel [Rubrobacteraceae bacterium]